MQIKPGRYWSLISVIVLVLNVFFFGKMHFNKVEPPKYQIQVPPDDFETIVDYKNFDYLISKPKCVFQNDTDYNELLPYFITFVHSKPTNVDVRNTMRDTWAHTDKRTKTYFLLGAVSSPAMQKQIEKEDAEYGDIIQGNFMDTYRNLTYKHMMALKWFTYNCADANYMVKMDDTVFINVPNVYKFLQNTDRKGFLMGPVFYTSKGKNKLIKRNEERTFSNVIQTVPRSGKFTVTREEYETRYFPNYAEKFALIYSSDVAIRLYQRAQKMRFFWLVRDMLKFILKILFYSKIHTSNNLLIFKIYFKIIYSFIFIFKFLPLKIAFISVQKDDVFITGLVRIQLNIKLSNLRSYLLDRPNVDRLKKVSMNLPRPSNFMFTCQYIDIEEQRLLWEKTEWSRLGINLEKD